MTIQLKPEQEQIVGQAIQAGLIANADDILDVGIDAIRQRLKSPRNGVITPVLSAEEWEREFDTWIESFPDTAPLPDEALRRENLYPDRG
jgi:hypothetical protein